MRKILFYSAYTLPMIYWTYFGLTDQLGAEPIDRINWQSGYVVLYLLVANLLLGVLISFRWTKIWGLKYFFQERRSLGVASGIYVILHFLTYLVDEAFERKAWSQIFEKFYLQVGASAAVILIVLTITSNQYSVKKLGMKKWKNLHRVGYLGFAFATMHVLNIEKSNLPLLYCLTMPLWGFQFVRAIRFAIAARTSAKQKI